MIGKIQKLKNKKGFTLVELIVVIAIIAILTAVIVPLVSRYTAQAQYTTLQNNAATISSSANTAMADANQKGVVSATSITGKKGDGTFTIVLGSSGEITDGTVGDNDDADKIAAHKLWAALDSALPAECSFYVDVKSAAVNGVVYSTTKGTVAEEIETIVADTGYDEAYRANSTSGAAIGVTGIYMKDEAHGPAYKEPASKT